MDRPLQYLQFSGKEEDFAVWQERFEGFCFTKKLLNVLNGTDAGTNDKKYEIWAYLVQCLDGFRTFRHKTFRQQDGGRRFGNFLLPKRLWCRNVFTAGERRFGNKFSVLSSSNVGAYSVYARSPSPSQRPAPTTIASRSPFPLGLCSCSTSLSKMGI